MYCFISNIVYSQINIPLKRFNNLKCPKQFTYFDVFGIQYGSNDENLELMDIKFSKIKFKRSSKTLILSGKIFFDEGRNQESMPLGDVHIYLAKTNGNKIFNVINIGNSQDYFDSCFNKNDSAGCFNLKFNFTKNYKLFFVAPRTMLVAYNICALLNENKRSKN